MGSRRYAGFLRYDVQNATVSVFFSPCDKVNHMTILTGRYRSGMSYLAQVRKLTEVMLASSRASGLALVVFDSGELLS